MKNFGTTLLHLAIASAPLSSAAATNAYYGGRRGAYGKNNQYLVDEGLSALTNNNWTKKKAKKVKTGLATKTGINDSSELGIVKAQKIRELVIIDQNIKNSHLFYKLEKPGVEIVEIPEDSNGLEELINILEQYEGLNAVHLFSHANSGKLFLGNEVVSKKQLENDLKSFSALNSAIKKGGDFLIYGCDLAKGNAGDEFLEIIKGSTNIDIAASDDKTGNEDYHGDWDLEIQKGNIDIKPLANSIAMKNFTGLMGQYTGIIDFSLASVAGYINGGDDITFNVGSYTLIVDGTTYYTYHHKSTNPSNPYERVSSYWGETRIALSFDGDKAFTANSISTLR